MAETKLIFVIEVGFDPDRGYAALVTDPINKRAKGVRGNSIEQLSSRLRHVLNEEVAKRKNFPLPVESERSRIITPNGFE